jgi:hypothetical protein
MDPATRRPVSFRSTPAVVDRVRQLAAAADVPIGTMYEYLLRHACAMPADSTLNGSALDRMNVALLGPADKRTQRREES